MTPQYVKEGWLPAGPGRCRCPKCGKSTTTNALGRAAHKRACEERHRWRDAERQHRLYSAGAQDDDK